jgi:hypothetical protein
MNLNELVKSVAETLPPAHRANGWTGKNEERIYVKDYSGRRPVELCVYRFLDGVAIRDGKNFGNWSKDGKFSSFDTEENYGASAIEAAGMVLKRGA